MAIFSQADSNGSLVRGQFEWDYYFKYKKQPNFAIFYDHGKPRAYVVYRFHDMTFVIDELMTLDEQAKNAAYRFIASHAGAFDKFSYTAPSNARLEQDMLEPSRAKISLLPYMMARIVNLPEFLSLFPVNDQRRFTITDAILPENNLSFGEGDAVTMTIGEFTNYVMGDVILREYF
jgi:predicted acetyltransferase